MNLLRGRTVTGLSLTVLFLAMTGGDALAQQGGPGPAPPPASRMPSPMLPASAWGMVDDTVNHVTTFTTPKSLFAATDPFVNPSNLLPNVYANVKSTNGAEIPNTLPSTPKTPYNLHLVDPITVPLSDSTSPTDDLEAVFKTWYTGGQKLGSYKAGNPYDQTNYHFHPEYFNKADLQRGLDVLEGNPIAGRAYSGMPILHINGGDEVSQVIPIVDPRTGKTIGGNVTVHQVWFDQHIEESTSYIDTSLMNTPENENVTWTITYVVDVLTRGNDDFSPLELFNSDPKLDQQGKPCPPKVEGKPDPICALPQVMMDGTFFPMADKTRNVFILKMPPARFYQLIYTWGWRNHPGRIAVMENAEKFADLGKGGIQRFPDIERNVFRQVKCDIPPNGARRPLAVLLGEADTQGNPLPGAVCQFGPKIMSSAASKAYAISFIGDLAPAKRMWNALKTLQSTGYNTTVMAEYERAFYQWRNRLQLPDGIKADPNADLTLVYLNNSLYGQQKGMSRLANKPTLEQWKMRGTRLQVKVYNGDYFPHGYGAVNFGGLRGWENLYQSAHPIGGDGDTFTFGRAYWGLDTAPKVTVVPAAVKSGSAAVPATMEARSVMAKNHALALQPMDALMSNALAARRNSPLVQKVRAQSFNFQPDTEEAIPTLGVATVPAVNGDTLGAWTINFNMNYEPSLRLRTYQFDPIHHIQAIWAIH